MARGFSEGPSNLPPTVTCATNVRRGSEPKNNPSNKQCAESHDANTDAANNSSIKAINLTVPNVVKEKYMPKSKYNGHMNKIKRQAITAIFNYSTVKLTQDMEDLLNLGLKFAILPLKLDITHVLVDFRTFQRNMVWREFFNDKEDEEFIPPIFKSKKYNLPKNHNTPTGLKTYLGAVKSEITDPRNRNKASCNIPKEQLVALKELIKLQRDRKIIIKRCD